MQQRHISTQIISTKKLERFPFWTRANESCSSQKSMRANLQIAKFDPLEKFLRFLLCKKFLFCNGERGVKLNNHVVFRPLPPVSSETSMHAYTSELVFHVIILLKKEPGIYFFGSYY